ncbi:MAG: SoxR reducing system RseC family protein [Planctomycetota bacterium]|jgi:positive regulator of sigma E activity|nr:SoxR reducing system RseC family protein [Planctomycetota bacterium]
MRENAAAAGFVLHVNGNLVRVRTLHPGRDEGCAASCATCGLFGEDAEPSFEFDAVLGEGMRPPLPGDRVRVVYRRANQAALAALFFLPPLLGMAAGLSAGSGLEGGLPALSALAGGGIGFAVSARLHRAFSKRFGVKATVASPE